MVEEVAKNIYRISVPLPNNPLKELNSYFLRGKEKDLLIDTGFRCEECQKALEEGLCELGSDRERRDVLGTHLHSDHCGMADLFAGKNCRIYMAEKDLAFIRRYIKGEISPQTDRRFLQEGFPKEELDYVTDNNPARVYMLNTVNDRFCAVTDGDILDYGDFHLKTILVPGHTPGNSMFWAEEQEILFSGDHVLFDITPNITQWVEMEDALGDYIDSLKKVRALKPKLTLPGHRKTGNFQERVDSLLAHHEYRLGEAFRIIREQPGLNAYEITAQMTWRIRARNWEEFPLVQKWFAVGECLSHLDYLIKRGRIAREEKDGIRRYFAV